jgi:hypothetical protein
VIYDNGVLSSCENKPDVLSLRDYDWNFQAAWNTDLMKARRKEAGADVSARTSPICFYRRCRSTPAIYVKIKKLEKQMKKAAKR